MQHAALFAIALIEQSICCTRLWCLLLITLDGNSSLTALGSADFFVVMIMLQVQADGLSAPKLA